MGQRSVTPSIASEDIERQVRAALTMVATPADETVGATLAEYGGAESSQRWSRGFGPGALCRAWGNALIEVNEVLTRATTAGLRFVIPGDPEWPVALNDLDTSAPYGLWVRSATNLSDIAHRTLAIVGARDATAYGERIAAQISAAASDAGITTVSGGAVGIDAAVHRGTLAVGGRTIAVMACGADVAYPPAHIGLFERIVEAGAVVSEAAPGAQVRKHLFLTRNRIIAALSSHVVVVEAALRSGALNTATWASSLGRELWAVPGPLTSPASAGTNRTIAQGNARLLWRIDEVIAQYPADSTMPFPESALGIVQALSCGPCSVDRLCDITGLQVGEVMGALSILELYGAATSDSGIWSLTLPRGA